MAVTPETPIVERFAEIVARYGDVPALTSPRTRHTYAELDRWSDAIAAEIASHDAPPEHPVALLLHDHVALVPAAIAAVKAGHYFVVIDASEPEERIATILASAGARLRVDETFASTRASSEPRERFTPRTPHELVQLVFTSGTTGTPKAIANRQRYFVERCVSSSSHTGRAAGERVSYTALPGFARATYEIFGSLLNGATLCAFDARSESLDALGEYIERERISTLTLTPALFRRFVMTAPSSTDLSSVMKLRIGADVVSLADVEAYKQRFPPHCTLERGFNASETAQVLHMTIRHDTPVDGPLVPIGRPRPGVHVRLVDDDRNEVPIGEVGELVVRSRHVVPGYWNAPELTAEKFAFEHPDEATFFTGDLLRRDEDGLFYFIGRKDARLKIHGRRIDPVEVESALIAHAGAREAVAVGKPGAGGELHLVAYVVMRDGRACSPREMRAALRDKVPNWMIPARIHALDAIPMARSGKVDRESLRTRVEADVITDGGAADDLERTLLDIWSSVTGVPVHVDDDFFDDLGGESIVAAHLVTEVHRATGRVLPLSLLLELNTVARMADYLRLRVDLERTAVVVQRGGDRPPIFCVSGKGGSVIVFRRLATLLGEDQPFYGLTHHGFARETFPKTFAAIAACYVDTIRTIQPEGPYFIAGYSAGGLIAYDIARQLTRAGHEVAFVGLIDTAAKSDRAPAWRRSLKHFALLRQRPLKNGTRYARAVARRALGLIRPTPPPEIGEMNRLFESVRREPLQPYPGHVTLFLARYGWGTDGATPDLGWRALAGSLEIIPIPGEHHTILRDDVAALASAMAQRTRNAAD